MKISEMIIFLQGAEKEIGNCDVLADFWKVDNVSVIKEYDDGDTVRPIVNIS